MDLDDSVINSLKDDDYDTSCVHHSSMKQEFPKGKNAALEYGLWINMSTPGTCNYYFSTVIKTAFQWNIFYSYYFSKQLLKSYLSG